MFSQNVWYIKHSFQSKNTSLLSLYVCVPVIFFPLRRVLCCCAACFLCALDRQRRCVNVLFNVDTSASSPCHLSFHFVSWLHCKIDLLRRIYTYILNTYTTNHPDVHVDEHLYFVLLFIHDNEKRRAERKAHPYFNRWTPLNPIVSMMELWKRGRSLFRRGFGRKRHLLSCEISDGLHRRRDESPQQG